MKTAMNMQPNPVTLNGVPTIPAYTKGKVDETDPQTKALIEDGALRLDDPAPKKAPAKTDDKEKSE